MKPIEDIAGRLGNRMFQFAYVYAQMKRGAVPDVWLQGPQYFEDCADDIRQMYGSGIVSRPEVAVHIRRGDYTWQPMFVKLWETDYYERAMALFPSHQFLIISDDPDWCRDHFSSDRCRVVGGQNEIEDLNMMAGCQHTVIANSSFSWWAGFLNPNQNKIVVYPRAWHIDGVQRIQFPKEWVAL